MIHRIEVRLREDFADPHAEGVLAQIQELGVETVSAVRSARLFFLEGQLSAEDARRVAAELLADSVIEEFQIGGTGLQPVPEQNQNAEEHRLKTCATTVIEVHRKSGVMDPVAASAEQAISDMGLEVSSVRTARRYELAGEVTDEQRVIIARRLLANDVIEDVHFSAYTPPETRIGKYELKIVEIPIRQLDAAGLEKVSKDRDLFLNVTEMKTIQDHYQDLGREPTDVEIETIAQTWSEHCVHKTFRSDVCVRDNSGKVVEEIPNLIKTTIFAATKKLNKPWCISVFEDNAGVIEFDDDWAVCFKVETHNHPSALDPYGGAGTGIGGVVRDPMGTGLGALPVANTDVFCFGPPDMPLADVPKGVLHPRRIMRGVVAGVRDYGNRMGIPTVNGAVYFDEKYIGNPLVYCGTVGLMPREKCFGNPAAGDAIVCVGGRTGRDGIHGATFSSGELTHEHEEEFSGAVQIGNAITEKKMLDTLIQARDAGLYSAITDCGAGGLASAVGEMGEHLGAEVHLDRVPLKYAGLSYWEIWESEAQERMVLAVPPENVEEILKIFAAEGVEATVIGNYGTADKHLRLLYDGQLVGELAMEFLHDGLPRTTKEAVYQIAEQTSQLPKPRENYSDVLLKILAAPNVASKEWIVRQYDHEVQGGSVIKPLVGVEHDGPGDAAVVRPVLTSRRGLVISCGMNPRLGELDPYNSALHAIDEALRNNIAVGGNIAQMAILDNFSWGNCNKPDRMGALVAAAKACYDGAMAYGTPFISGKDSLNNEFQTETGETIAIPPTLLISAISVIEDISRCVTADAKEAGNILFLLGTTTAHLGGSHYLLVEGAESGTDVPPVNPAESRKVMEALQKTIAAG
ncbi:MAG: phosphoribosylformylglycinamidine synthase subunit PurL, partial [Planctomycetota bacterium]|nr:phosphoribosylformylglycinamidine synthase subunit PurL [Planctomycetota bacterium]